MKSISDRCRTTHSQACHICEDKACGDNTNSTEPVVGYWLSRSDCGGLLFAGVTPEDVATVVKNEIDANGGLLPDECGEIILTAVMTTQAEIDSLPEFSGW